MNLILTLLLVCVCVGFTVTVVYLREILIELRRRG